ncbi:MAG: hypothetical protein C4541_00080 [Candidatus Auribacter fodinae]|uniref:Uncharacterized protein n=1 Tax=Candidatus Auribacter fodinae TaxID=2093366 RepID=A0A3A4R739_9BACT|nr:MAG: hypothetical protein C4541_00080 [Candidatus Auribacter fodinae]
MRNLTTQTIIIALLTAFLSGCGVMRNAVLQTAKPVFADQLLAMYRESDYELAQTAIPANIKVLEGLVLSYPDDTQLKLWLTESLCGYAVGFLEETDPERASSFYLRAKNCAVSAAIQKAGFKNEYLNDPDRLKKWIDTRTLKDVPYLFWLGQSWGSWIAINVHKPQAMADMSKLQWIMNRVLELDESFYHAGAHIVMGAILGNIPVMFGGNPDKSLGHFDRAFELTNRSFLLVHYYCMKTYCVSAQDKKLFNQLNNEVSGYDLNSTPDTRLMNVIAKKRMETLTAQQEDLFFDE